MFCIASVGRSIISLLMAQVQGSGAGQVKQLFSYDANGDVVSVNYNGTEYFYLRNGQNDVVGLMDGSGNRVVEYTYDAWGKLISTTGTLATSLGADNPFRYRGYYYDTETGLYYLMTRYYDPEVCRFISADVYMTTGQGVLGGNMWAYCLNNPVNMVDQTGSEAVAIALGLAAKIAGVLCVTAVAILAIDFAIRRENSFLSTISKGIVDGLESLMTKITEKIETKEPKQYKRDTEVHHIVAQSSPYAAPAQDVLRKTGISVNSAENTVEIKTSLHRRLHTYVYYGIVNTATQLAYKAGKTPKEKRSNVKTTLRVIGTILSATSKILPY